MSQPPHPENPGALTPEDAAWYRVLFAGFLDLVEKARVAAIRSTHAHLTAEGGLQPDGLSVEELQQLLSS